MRSRLSSERGTTLIETMFACTILLIVIAGLLGMASVATVYTENNGHLDARAIEYAQDKMEQLLALGFTNQIADTTAFPTAATGGTGLAVGGTTNLAAPVNGYVDWLAADGTLLGGGSTPPANWYYERVWQVTQSGALIQITVACTVATSLGNAWKPRATVVALKSPYSNG